MLKSLARNAISSAGLKLFICLTFIFIILFCRTAVLNISSNAAMNRFGIV